MSRIPINEVYFVSKHANQRGVLRLQACQEFQSTRCTSSPSMSRIPINDEVYFGFKHVKNCNQRGVLRLQACQESTRCTSFPSSSKHVNNSNQRGVLRLQACQEFQSTRCTSSPSMSRIPINEVYFVSKHVKNSNQQGVLRLQACQE